jgi:hypothetical protein
MLALAAFGLLLLLIGPVRRPLGGAFVVIEWQHAVFAAAALAAVRHAWKSSPSILASIGFGRAALAKRPALADALLAFWLTRPAVLLVGFLAVVTIGLSPHAERMGGSALGALPNRFDAGWYAGIAAQGYEWQYRFDRQQNIAFFPAYPMVLRGAGLIAGAFQPGLPDEARIARLAWTGAVISAVAFFFACWYFSRLARELLDGRQASAAVLLLASYPFSIFYSAAYTESLFLLAALGTWYHFRHRQWARAALWGLLVGLTRPNGFFLSVPLALLALGAREAGSEPHPAGIGRGHIWTRLAVAAMPAVGMLLFSAYLYSFTRVWFAWARMHGAWGRVLGATPVLPDSRSPIADGLIGLAIARPYEAMNAFGLFFALGLSYAVWRRVGGAWAVFVLVTLFPPLFAGGLLSMGRLTSTLFPLFLALASLLPPRAALACAAAFGVLEGFAAALFFTWRELY